MLPTLDILPRRPRRRPVQKSFSGCKQCKTRKIKCDETKPSCLRCTEKGWSCPGFPTQLMLRWSKKHELPERRTVRPKHKTSIGQHQHRDRDSQSDSAGFGTRVAAAIDIQVGLAAATETRDSAASIHILEVRDNLPASESSELFHHSINDCHLESNIADLNDELKLMLEKSYQASPNSSRDLLTTIDLAFLQTCQNLEAPSIHENEALESLKPLDVEDELHSPVENLDSTSNSWTTSFGSEDNSPVPLVPSKSPSDHFRDSGHQVHEHAYLSTELVDLPSKLVQTYFTIICPIFSTFDSQQNLFRSFVGRKWQKSSSMFYAMLSMAAAKLARQSTNMRLPALEFQSLAIRNLYTAVSNASGWNTELLFVVLMLGLSTSWHSITDLGLVHLEALQHAIHNKTIECSDEFDSLEFFKEALVYWEMVTCFICQGIPLYTHVPRSDAGSDSFSTRLATGSARGKRVIPHPWGGIASGPQAKFARAARLIQEARSFNQVSLTEESVFIKPEKFLQELNTLEEQLWGLRLPNLHEIANTGDQNTPAIHHLLLAEAYMLANFYQLYFVFPNLRRSRVAKLVAQCSNSAKPNTTSWAQYQATSWYSILQATRNEEEWSGFLGRSIIERLEQIQVNSGTLCVQPLLLLVGSMALSVEPDLVGSDEEQEILRLRQFVIDRLTYYSRFYLSDPIYQVKLVVQEIFARLDVGVKVFWMDVLKSMDVITIIG